MSKLSERLGRRGPTNTTHTEQDRIFGRGGVPAGRGGYQRGEEPVDRSRFDRGDETVDRSRFDREDETASRGRFGRRDEAVDRGRFGRRDTGRRRGRGAGAGGARFALARAITTIAAIVALIIVVGIVLVLLKANPAQDIVKVPRDAAKFLSQPFDAIFEMDRRRTEIAVNWGIAAVVYLAVGGLLARLLRR